MAVIIPPQNVASICFCRRQAVEWQKQKPELGVDTLLVSSVANCFFALQIVSGSSLDVDSFSSGDLDRSFTSTLLPKLCLTAGQ